MTSNRKVAVGFTQVAGARTARPHLHMLTAVEVFHVGLVECPLF